MSFRSCQFVMLASTFASVGLGCSSSGAATPSEKDAASDQPDALASHDAAAASPFTVLVSGELKGDVTQSESLYQSFVGASRAEAQAGGDTGHNVFLNKDPIADAGDAAAAPHLALTIDRWSSPSGQTAFTGTKAAQSFLADFYATPPDTSTWSPAAGWTTWGSPSDFAPGASNYVITLRGRYQGAAAAAQATHNGIVGSIPAPGAQGLGNSAHMIFMNPNDSGEMLIIEVWTNESNQEMTYAQLGPAIAKLWAGMPTITRWSTTDWTHW